MRVIHMVPAITEEASGPSYSVVRLCESLIKADCKITLAALDWAPMDSPPPFLKAFRLGMGPRRLGNSPAMYRWLKEEARSGRIAIIHSHGMWQLNALYPGWVAKAAAVKMVASTRGSLSQWAMRNGSPAKRVFWPLLQRPALEMAACFHATAESEYEDIRRMGFRQPVAVIPNGMDVPALRPKRKSEQRTLLFLGRIHPKKGLDLLLPAWRRVQDRFPEWRLIVAGPDNGGYLSQMKRLAIERKLRRMEFVGPLYGEEKWRVYGEADLFVLPTYSENFALTVAEALAAGTPAIVSKGAPWGGLESHGAGWWIDVGLVPLVANLGDALSRSREALQDMGDRGREWMQEEFSWAGVARQMIRTYRWILNGGTRPDWVRID